VHFLPQVVEFL